MGLIWLQIDEDMTVFRYGVARLKVDALKWQEVVEFLLIDGSIKKHLHI